jgi:hypothetical protein
MQQHSPFVLAAFAFACASPALLAGEAHAQSLKSCGDINVQANAECEVVPPSASCEAQCTPLNVQAACAAKLTAECEGECNATAELDCHASCEADCTGQCNVDPGKFECNASCQASCEGDCSGHCAASGNRAECEASCKANCTGSCNASCDIERPKVDCMAECKASCDGSCHAKANAECQIDCQADLYAKCKVDVEGGCKVDCMSQQGALFCSGQYVDHGNNLQECVDALRAQLNARVTWQAEGDSSCGNGSCMAEGSASASCSVPTPFGAKMPLWALGASVLSASFVARRKKR